MRTYSSNTGLVIGLAAFGLAMVATGVQLCRRKQAGWAAASTDREAVGPEPGAEAEPIQGEDPVVEGETLQKRPPIDFRRDLPLDYFLLVFGLSVPFWLVSSLLGNKLPGPINLPISALAFMNPMIAASILTYRRSGSPEVVRLVRRAIDYQKIRDRLWYLPTLFLMPSIYFLSYLIMRWIGSPLPDPINVPLLIAPVLFIVFFISAIGEELGWTGYAIDPMQKRWGALKASILLGVIWQIWHFIGNIQQGHSASWILWHSLYSIALRILIVWIYNNTGKSVFAAILVHTMDNVSVFLFPNYGSHYDPLVTGVITWLAAGLVTLLWGSKTLARFRFARLSPA